MTGIKDKIENNITLWLLGTLFTGFMAGIGTYEGALKIMNLQKINTDRLTILEEKSKNQSTYNFNKHIDNLPSYVGESEIELLFTKIKTSYNAKDSNKLYQLLGPIRKSQLSQKTVNLQMEPVYKSLGKIESGFFIQHQFFGQQGLYKLFMLNFSVKYENAEKGIMNISIIDNGKSYQVDGVMFNRI
ncbi:MAG: hypothetical protein OEM02_11150 [Desulfobulbaceae bacterium]|nr:hypothetical protein [Desulfobulbaceae bacterium]